MRPNLRFKIDYKKDVSTLFSFVNEFRYLKNDRNLKWAILNSHPFFKKYQTGTSVKIGKIEAEKYVKSFYQKNYKIMRKNIKLYEINWRKVEQNFYYLVNNLFELNYWPKGKYVAYVAIWGMFPRFLEDKTFQLPFRYRNKNYINVIIAHEMLHFIFYDYFFKKYPKYKSDKYDFFVWHISEVFNVIIQNAPDWLRVFKVKTMEYPEHKIVTERLKKKYYLVKNWTVDDLICDIIKAIKESKLV